MSSKDDTGVSAQQGRSGEEERNFRAPKASKRHFTPAPRESAVARRIIESEESSPPSVLARDRLQSSRSLPARLLNAANTEKSGKQSDESF